jgi:large subunit ribosomal protein L41
MHMTVVVVIGGHGPQPASPFPSLLLRLVKYIMFPTLARFSKASRLPLTPKRGNKDYYKGKIQCFKDSSLTLKEHPMTTGTRQAYLPGGHRTGAPGKHVVRGKAKYRLLDEKVRFFVAPPVEEINSSSVRHSLSRVLA